MNNDFIIFGSCDWDTNWQTQHRLVSSLCKNENRVLFVENTGVRSLKFRDFNRVKKRIKNWLNSDIGFKSIDKNLTLYHPIFLPFQYSKSITRLNNYFILKSLNSWTRSSRFTSPIIISFLATPLIRELIRKIGKSAVVYYCANDNSAEHLGNKKFKENEIEFEKEANAVFVTSEKLKERALLNNDMVFKFPAAVELEKVDFKQKKIEEIEKIKKPIVGFVGSITNNIDQELILNACNENKNINFVFIGSITEFGQNIDKLKNFKNCFFLGKKKHEEIFEFIKNFDVGIIPYKVNQFTNAVYPAKLNEYLATGIPVLSTNIHEISKYNQDHDNVIYVSKDQNDFSNKIKFIVENLHKIDRKKIFTAAKKNSWKIRFEKINEALNTIEKETMKEKKNWQNEFRDQIYKSKKIFYKNISIIFLVIFLIFISPLPFFAGSYLSSKMLVKESVSSDLVLAINGYGTAKYDKLSSQQLLMNLTYYNSEKKIDKIIVSGRKNLKAELLYLQKLLISSGISASRIILIDEGYNSLFENIRTLKENVLENNIKEVDILTDRYSRKRFEIIFKKINPEVKLNFLENQLNEKESIWFTNWLTLKSIIYEYAAIIYNKIKYNL